jgi:hypothetical protein
MPDFLAVSAMDVGRQQPTALVDPDIGPRKIVSRGVSPRMLSDPDAVNGVEHPRAAVTR